MAVSVQLFDAAGVALREGLTVELLRGGEVVAAAPIDHQGMATFAADPGGPLSVRLQVNDGLLASPAPVTYNGVRADGSPARAPSDAARIAAAMRPAGSRAAPAGPGLVPHAHLPVNRDARKWEHTGWAIVFAAGAPASLRKALSPLIDHRRVQLEKRPDLHRELEYRSGEDARAFLDRYGADQAQVNPGKVPYYLLLVGGPGEIPFQVQYDLALGYAVGRLAFDTEADYAAYAASVVEQESAPATTRDVLLFGTRHPNDAATQLSDAKLVDPLDRGVPGDDVLGNPPAREAKFSARSLRGAGATRAALLDALDGGAVRPSLLFAAGHGLALDIDDEAQAARQGALLCAEWPGKGAVSTDALLTAASVEGATVKGLVAFVFACHGAGTTARDDIDGDPEHGAEQAHTDFVAALPKRLLAHPKGSALAFIGHVNTATGFSIEVPGAGTSQVVAYWNAAVGILLGEPIGHAVRSFADRVGVLSARLATALAPAASGAAPGSVDLVASWLERNDARNQIVLGDPAVRLRV